MPEMRIEYEIREEDYYEAHQLATKSFSRFNRPWLAYAIGGVMLAIPFMAMLLHLFESIYIMNFLLAPLFLGGPWLIRRRIHSIYSKAQNFRGTFIAEFDNDGISAKGTMGEGKSKWAAFQT